ncbi:MAG: acyl-CoA/acyl-ACP dehydrogenase [Cyanobacteria bacterium REEB67]|nr:acyl-CoA/acyl-ACP dehydrogenase [Cyanobacteria bacterium REEB67]
MSDSKNNNQNRIQPAANTDANSGINNKPDDNLAEQVLKQGGKSAEEVERTGKLDRGDEAFEATFDAKFRTTGSPVHKAVWDSKTPLAMFAPQRTLAAGNDRETAYLAQMDRCIAFVAAHVKAGTIYGADNKVAQEVLDGLSALGYWGALIDPQYGGWGATITHFMHFLSRMASEGDATVAGMASIHGCIGLVDPVSSFGSEAQKAKYLPLLQSKVLSAFALTEPNAGSDLTALRTTAVLEGDHYRVNGKKLFISNILPGRTIALVALIDGKPAVLIADLPAQEDEHFQLDRYGIHAVQHIHNYGIVFKDFLVPRENLLVPTAGDGLQIAYHGLNRGRVALCANAAGTMRVLLKSMVPWNDYRWTYGDRIGNRELVLKRVGRTAAAIVGADALVEWCSSLLDAGYRGELECIVAKVFGSEALKEVTVENALKTHGGRSFLKGHVIGDNLHDFLAPMIYEGEGEMLSMAEFKSLVKDHGVKYMGPIATRLGQHGIKGFNPADAARIWNPSKAYQAVRTMWILRRELFPIATWIAGAHLRKSDKQQVQGMDPRLARHVAFALKNFRALKIKVNDTMITHQMKLADRQCIMVDLSMEVQRTVTILAAAQYAHGKGDEATILAADVLCQDLTRKIKPGRESASYFRTCVKLGQLVADGKFEQIEKTADSALLRTYEDNAQRQL